MLDLVMWTFNGEKTLRQVLTRINTVIPSEEVNQRLIIDDGSTDNTIQIAKECGWKIISNDGKGIGDAANTALRHVETYMFASFEQDLLLSYDWFSKVKSQLDGYVVVVSGVRNPNTPKTMQKINNYFMTQHQQTPSMMHDKSLDNTLYNTSVIREVGGFPKINNEMAGVDTLLVHKLQLYKYVWKVDYSVKSVHLRRGIFDELHHIYSYAKCYPLLNIRCYSLPLCVTKKDWLKLLLSPIRGMYIAYKIHSLYAVFFYPLIRYYLLKGIHDGGKCETSM